MAIRPFLHLPPPAPSMNPTEQASYMRRMWDALYSARRGKIECVIEVTLAANAASTAITDARISKQTVFAWHPKTANAAAELAAGTLYVTDANISNGSATVTHANNAQTDRHFRVALIG